MDSHFCALLVGKSIFFIILDNTEKTGSLTQYGCFSSKISSEYFLNIAILRKIFLYYTIEQNYGNWILQNISIL